ncbi:MAG: hypothetical protein JWM53_1902 [bacterium]|nr:hypothetical protein [bacterium]
MNRLASTIVIALVLVASGLAFAGEIPYSVAPYEHDKISVTPEKIWLKGDKIWFKLRVANASDKVLMFDKEQIQAKLPDGRVLARARSVFAGQAKPSTVIPGGSQPLWVEYVIGKAPLQVSLQFSHGFILDGKPISLPDFVANPGSPQ